MAETLEQILAEIDSLTQPAPEVPLTARESGLGFARSLLSGPTMNFGDELEAGGAAVMDRFLGSGAPISEGYGRELQQIRSEQARFKDQIPYLDNVVEIGASFANPIAGLGKLASGANYGLTTASKLLTNPLAQAAVAGAGAAQGDESRLGNALKYGAIGGGISAGASIFGRAVGSAANQADRLKLSAFGVQNADIAKQVKKLGDRAANLGDASEIPLVRTVEKAEGLGLISAADDAVTNAGRVVDYQKQVNASLRGVLDAADQVLPPNPNFGINRTLKYINTLSGSAKSKAEDAALAEWTALSGQIGNGTLADLQRLKVGLNYKWDQNPYTDSVIKTLRSDLRGEIEDRINTAAQTGILPSKVEGQIRALNGEWGEMADLKDVFLKRAGRSLQGDAVEDTFGAMRTSGGAGTLNLAAVNTGNPVYAAAGMVLNAARLPEAKSALGDALREANQVGARIGLPPASVGAAIPEVLNARTGTALYGALKEPAAGPKQQGSSADTLALKAILAEIDQLTQPGAAPVAPPTVAQVRFQPASFQAPLDSAFQNLQRGATPMKGKVDVNLDIMPLADAVQHVESRGKPGAVSVKGATGLMQVMPATAKEIARELEIEDYDLKDPTTNRMFGEYYLSKMLKMFKGNQELALAAYNAGPGKVREWLAKYGNSWDDISAELEQRGHYLETVKYVPSVLDRMSKNIPTKV